MGSNVSHAVCCSPLGYVALSHLACILMPLHSFILQLPSPSHCVWCQLDKFSLFFFALHFEPLQDNVNCDITITTTSPSAHTGHTLSSSPPTPSLPPQHHHYLTNVAVTTAAHQPLHASHGTKTTPPPSLSLCLVPPKYFLFYFTYFSFHLELVQDSAGCDTTATAVTSHAHRLPHCCHITCLGHTATPLLPPLHDAL